MKRRELLGPFIQAAIRAGAEIWDCTLLADHAIAVRRLERIKTAMRSGPAGDCPFYEEFEADTGAQGEPPCYIKPPKEWDDEEPCPECRLKIAEKEHVRPLLANARRRLRAAIDRRIQ